MGDEHSIGYDPGTSKKSIPYRNSNRYNMFVCFIFRSLDNINTIVKYHPVVLNINYR